MAVQNSTLNVSIITARPELWLESNFETAGGKTAIAQRLVDYIQRIISGNELAYGTSQPPSLALSITGNAVRASGTLTCVSVIATDTVLINGVEFAAVNSGATGNQFVRTADNTVTATNLAAAINASVTALVSGYVTATSALGVVTVYSTNYGIFGNQVTMSTTGGTITSSVTRLAGGIADATAQTLSF